jgi:hypothetical protein
VRNNQRLTEVTIELVKSFNLAKNPQLAPFGKLSHVADLRHVKISSDVRGIRNRRPY